MKVLLIFCAAGVSGCATAPQNPWQDLTTETEPAVTALVCRMPLPDEVVGETIIYESAHVLEDYRQCSEANMAIANENAAQIDQLKVARKGLTEAGQAQRNIAEMRQEMLEDERRHHLYQSIGYWLMIAVLGVAVL